LEELMKELRSKASANPILPAFFIWLISEFIIYIDEHVLIKRSQSCDRRNRVFDPNVTDTSDSHSYINQGTGIWGIARNRSARTDTREVGMSELFRYDGAIMDDIPYMPFEFDHWRSVVIMIACLMRMRDRRSPERLLC
jgi:hypothetical protein